MLLGFGSYIFRYAIGNKNFQHDAMLTPIEVLEKSSELGAEVLQFADNCPLDNLSKEELDNLKKRSEELNVKLEAGMAGLTKERLIKNLEIAKHLNTNLLRVATHYNNIEPSNEEIIKIIKEVLPKFQEAGVSIAIENHFTITSIELVNIINEIGNPLVGVCLDTGNSIAQKEWPRETTELLAPYCLSLHLKDFKLSMEPDGLGVDIRGKILSVDSEDIFFHIDTVKKYTTNFNVILEQWMEAEETARETLEKEEAWIKQNLINAKSYFN